VELLQLYSVPIQFCEVAPQDTPCSLGMVQNDMQVLYIAYIIRGGQMGENISLLDAHPQQLRNIQSNIWRICRFVTCPVFVPVRLDWTTVNLLTRKESLQIHGPVLSSACWSGVATHISDCTVQQRSFCPANAPPAGQGVLFCHVYSSRCRTVHCPLHELS
jgi:hypothetical protein